MPKLRILIATLLFLSIGVGSALYFNQVAGAQDNSDESKQQQIVNEITERLQKQSIPVTLAQIVYDKSTNVPYPMNILDITLKSSSDNDKVAPNDGIFSNIVGHEVKLAQKRGLTAEATRVTIVNTKGDVLISVILSLTNRNESPSNYDKKSILGTDKTTTLLNTIDTGKMAIHQAKVSMDEDGLLSCNLDIVTPDIDTTNSNIRDLIENTQNTILDLNTNHGASIAVYQIWIQDVNNQTILAYINDLQFGRCTWWQSDEVTKDWFNHPQAIENQ
jgi:hypothetical protein